MTEIRDDLERAAEEFAEREYECDSADRNALEKGFYWGAMWQKEQDEHRLTEDTLRTEYEKGRHDMLEELMSHSISGCYIRRNHYTKTNVLNGLSLTDKVFQGFENRDKIIIIVVKEGGAE